MQSLTQLKAPKGALAAARQAFRSTTTEPPNGVEFSHLVTCHRNISKPVTTSPPWLNMAFDAYLSAHTAVCARRVGDSKRLFDAETLELQHASAGVVRTDGSLPPRLLGLTLLLYGQVKATDPKTHLDAFAFWASTAIGLHNETLGAALMRFTVLAADDAAWFANSSGVAAETTQLPPHVAPSGAQLCVRWATKQGMRAECCELRGGVGLDRSLAHMQNFLVSLKTLFGAPVSDVVCVAHPNVVGDAWLESTSKASIAFASLMEGEASVQKLADMPDDADIGELNIYVRISERARGADGLQHESAFHGFLVGDRRYASEIKALAESFTELPPADEATAKFCLHTCAVQACEMPLGTRVSMYGPGGKPGESLLSTGNWIIRLDPAIVPLAAVLPNFVVTPCTHASTIPSDARLLKPAVLCANRAYALFCSVFGASAPTISGSEQERQPLCTELPAAGAREEAEKDELYAKTAFGVDMASRRVQVGDAYAMLAASAAPKEMTSFFLNSTLKYGVDCTMVDAIGHAAKLLVDFSHTENKKLAERMASIQAGALLVGCKRVREGNSTNSLSNKQITSFVAAAGLKAPKQCKLANADADVEAFYEATATVASLILPTHHDMSESETRAASCIAKSARAFGSINAVGAVAALLMQDKSARLGKIFVIYAKKNSDSVLIYLITLEGCVVPSTPGQLLDTAPRHVFFLRDATCADAFATLRAMQPV